MSSLSFPVQYSSGSLSQHDKVDEGDKGDSNREGKSQTASFSDDKI